jgi:hypothetical protein
MNDLIEAYKNTKYKVFEPDIIIEIGKIKGDGTGNCINIWKLCNILILHLN